MTDQPSPYDQLSDRARWFLENFDEINLADLCASKEASLARMRDRAEVAGVRADQAEAAIARVRALHAPNDRGNCSARCYTAGIAPAKSPCPTLCALDTPQDTDRA